MKYTMKDFIEKDIAVRLKKGNFESFLKACDNKGLLFRYGGRALHMLRYVKDAIEGSLDVALFFDKKRGVIDWNVASYCVKKGLLITDFEDVDLGEAVPSSPYRITIDCDGKTTTARMIINGKEIKSATARCNPADKFNFKVGATVAFNRLFSRDPKANDSDKFRIGDRVVCSYADDNHRIRNAHGKILLCGIGPNCCVEFDNKIGGHNADGREEYGHCWFVSVSRLRRE